jgi:hypothetical protein
VKEECIQGLRERKTREKAPRIGYFMANMYPNHLWLWKFGCPTHFDMADHAWSIHSLVQVKFADTCLACGGRGEVSNVSAISSINAQHESLFPSGDLELQLVTEQIYFERCFCYEQENGPVPGSCLSLQANPRIFQYVLLRGCAKGCK